MYLSTLLFKTTICFIPPSGLKITLRISGSEVGRGVAAVEDDGESDRTGALELEAGVVEGGEEIVGVDGGTSETPVRAGDEPPEEKISAIILKG